MARLKVSEHANDRAGRARGASGIDGIIRSARRLALLALRPDGGARAATFELVGNSTLFDRQWYLETYPDVAAARTDPLRHFMDIGWREGRDPGPDFASSAYLKANPDVAAAGMNPLLHFIQFGSFEGRSTARHRSPRQPASIDTSSFAPAAPVFSAPLPDEPPVRWTPACRLDRDNADFFKSGGCAVGYAQGRQKADGLRDCFSLLKVLSGYGRSGSRCTSRAFPQSAERLVDAWYVNASQLRTRWDGGTCRFVVRGFQHDPLCAGSLRLVGEGLVQSPIDTVDLHLASPFFPILFMFSAPDGVLRGAQLLAFPSLCRNGAHYSELVAVAGRNGPNIDPIAEGEIFGMRLLRLMEGDSAPAIAAIRVEIAGADGTERLFQDDFRAWLKTVFGIAIVAEPTDDDASVAQYLREAVIMAPSSLAGRVGFSLVLGPGMIPAITALTAPFKAVETEGEETAVRLIVAEADPSAPSLLLSAPAGMECLSASLGAGGPTRWPCLHGIDFGAMPSGLRIAAIALREPKDLSEMQLLMPVAGDALTEQLRTRPAISWLVEADGWAHGVLEKALLALSFQLGGDEDRIIFIGTQRSPAEAVAREAFGERVGVARSLCAAIAAAQTQLVGFVGAGVVLHDDRTALALAGLLLDESVASASCVLIAVHESGGAWHAKIADGGDLALGLRPLGAAEYRSAVTYLWGTSYPVEGPGRQFWLARTSSAAAMAEGAGQVGPDNGVHIFSSLVTASQVAPGTVKKRAIIAPPAASDRATIVQAFVG